MSRTISAAVDVPPCAREYHREPDLTTRTTADVEAWRQGIQDQHDAEEARRRKAAQPDPKPAPKPKPPAVKPVRPAEPAAPKGRPRDKGPVLRECVQCKRMTRPASMPIEEAPNTVTRYGGSLCRTCKRGGPDHVPHPYQSRRDPAVIAAVLQADRDGLTLAQIAELINRSEWTVTRILRSEQ